MAEVDLEKIDIVRERTGVSYEKAARALEAHGGNVVEAIVAIEKEQQQQLETHKVTVDKALEKIKQLLREGNVTRIRIKQGERVVADVPVTLGVVAALLAPLAAAIGAIAAVATRCTIEVERDNQQEE